MKVLIVDDDRLQRRNNMDHEVLGNRRVGPDTWVLRFQRQRLIFQPGQYLHIGITGERLNREYSIYSSTQENYMEILYREIPQGSLTPRLSVLKPGDSLTIEGPFGTFILTEDLQKQPLLFISTGTGISPFHCFTLSYPDLDYQILHGISTLGHRYDESDFPADHYLSCISREEGGGYRGRVTQWLNEHDISSYSCFMLCGNSDMIYEVFSLLEKQGISREQIRVETYF